jgi:ribosomal-protein-alanine N-acetyltransferase
VVAQLPDEPAPAERSLSVEIVPMRRRHLRAVLRIEAAVYPRPWSLALFLSELALRTTRAYRVARAAGSVVGYAGLMWSGDDAHVTTIAVDPAWQRHKVGTQLLLHLAELARARGARNLTLEVRVSNLGAQALYHQFGFAPAGIRKNYYTETNEDALVMWAEDIGSEAYGRRLAAIAARLDAAGLRGPQGASGR